MESLLMRIVFAREFPGLGRKIKELRQQSQKSLTQLAAEAGISVPHWNRIENERVQDLPIETLRGVEKALETDLGVNLGDA